MSKTLEIPPNYKFLVRKPIGFEPMKIKENPRVGHVNRMSVRWDQCQRTSRSMHWLITRPFGPLLIFKAIPRIHPASNIALNITVT